MPAPVDITGRVFGDLTVLRRDGKIKFGRVQSAWLCQCRCGGTIRLPLARLIRVPSPSCRSAVRSCHACRSHPCEVCGTPIPASSHSATCSAECATERRRAKWRENSRHRKNDAGYRAARAEYAAQYWKEDRARRAADPDYDAAHRQQRAAWRAAWLKENVETVRRYSRDYRRRQRSAENTTDMHLQIDSLTDEDKGK